MIINIKKKKEYNIESVKNMDNDTDFLNKFKKKYC